VSAEQVLAPVVWWAIAGLLGGFAIWALVQGLAWLIPYGAKLGIEGYAPPAAYRPDIDGLRALAVGIVVLFHLGLGWIPGGYVGVDVFFVISGYLITDIILRQLNQQRFSFFGFYCRRLRRIFPALFAMIGVSLAAGSLLLLPGDYVIAGQSAVYAMFAASNFYFLLHTGYFDAKAELMPLLHTWSLGVEEQFYLVWPALLVGATRWFGPKRRGLAVALLCVGTASFAANCLFTAVSPKIAFYMPYTRAWEFCAGALFSLATIPSLRSSRRASDVASWTGLLLLLGSALGFTIMTPFPGTFALIPVTGAALLVAPFEHKGRVRTTLSKGPVVFIGKISYSLYLWHWVIITLYRHYHFGSELSVLDAIALLAVIIPVSWLSWRYVEQPFRNVAEPAWRTFGKAAAAASVLFVGAMTVISSGGWDQRIPQSAMPYASLKAMSEWTCPQKITLPDLASNLCVLGAKWDTARTRGFLIGDSHAEHFAPLLDVAARQTHVALIHTPWSCMPLSGTTTIRRHSPSLPGYDKMCGDLYRPVLKYIRQHEDIKVIVVAAAWSGYAPELYKEGTPALRDDHQGVSLLRNGIEQLSAELGASDRRNIVVVSDVARRLDLDLSCFINSSLPLRASCPEAMFVTPLHSRARLRQDETNAMIRSLPDQDRHLIAVIPQDAQCDQRGCRTVVNGEFIYRDNGHLRMNLTPQTEAELVKEFHLREALDAAVPKMATLGPH
jgi:peptidoglycan/LPS O-acetylase OafA/YrhL